MKKKFLQCGNTAIALLLLIGCNNSGTGSGSPDSTAAKANTGTASDTGSSSAKVEKNPSTLTKIDSLFILTAANAGMTEVTLGNLAIQNSSNEKVKAFGEMMVKDHTTAGNQLKTIAGSKNITAPDSLNAESKKEEKDLAKKKGKEFDKVYINMMVTGHEKVLKDFEDEQSKGSDTELKAFVAQTIPIIKGHLDQAKSIKKELK